MESRMWSSTGSAQVSMVEPVCDVLEFLAIRHEDTTIIGEPHAVNFEKAIRFDSQRIAWNQSCSSTSPMDVEKGNNNKRQLKLQFGGCRVAPNLEYDVESSSHNGHGDPNGTLKVFTSYHSTLSNPSPLLTHSTSAPPATYAHQSSVGEELRFSLFKTANLAATSLKRPFSCVDIKKHSEALIEPNVARYFDALQGPELEILRESENTVLPMDKRWPFLLRFPIACFGICLGLGSQTMLCKAISTSTSMQFVHLPKHMNLGLWCLALLVLLLVSTTYILKCIFYLEAVRREFCHPVRVNYFFAPWIACMFLTLGAPPDLETTIHPSLWCSFMLPIVFLELKIYGQWLSGGEKRLSKVANPSTHLSLVGNFVGALLAANVGQTELAIFFWAVGLAHYVVLFVTLYQRLPMAASLPKELHPVFFLFISAPTTASVAWAAIAGDFDIVSRIAYFVGMFLYTSLVVRVNLFCGFRFSISWWAYTFPMTSSAIATIHYSVKVTHPITQGIALALSIISSVTVVSLCVVTIFQSCCSTLFPNDMAIAITNVRTPSSRGTRKKKKSKDKQVWPAKDQFIHRQ